MKHFSHLKSEELEEIFYLKPKEVNKFSKKELLERALGATLYIPGNKINISNIIIKNKIPGLSSVVLCLEDAIGKNEVESAEKNLIKNLKELSTLQTLPLIFIRVRNPEHFKHFIKKYYDFLSNVTGFVFPKFDTTNAVKYFEMLKKLNVETNKFYGMPILETTRVLNKRFRYDEFNNLLKIFNEYKEYLLNIRVGTTDLSGLYSLRRNQYTTVYDIALLRDFLGDVINYFKAEGFIISGGVWEYFEKNKTNRILKPELRESPFIEHYGSKGKKIRKNILNDYSDILIKEVLLDKENGFLGKTVIYPTHVIIVNSLMPVMYEEYIDALEILKNDGEGVLKSNFNNKMNEIKPHFKWAEEVIKKSKIYGVFNKSENFTSLLQNK